MVTDRGAELGCMLLCYFLCGDLPGKLEKIRVVMVDRGSYVTRVQHQQGIALLSA